MLQKYVNKYEIFNIVQFLFTARHLKPSFTRARYTQTVISFQLFIQYLVFFIIMFPRNAYVQFRVLSIKPKNACRPSLCKNRQNNCSKNTFQHIFAQRATLCILLKPTAALTRFELQRSHIKSFIKRKLTKLNETRHRISTLLI